MLKDHLQKLTPTHSLARRISAYDKAAHLSQKGGSSTEISNETGIPATSTSIRLLTYTRTILRECLGLKATLVYKGKPRPSVYKNKLFHSRKKVFDLRISRFGDVKQFSQVVGFELARKQRKLDAAIAVRERFGSGQDAVEEWTRHWERGKTEWTLRKSVD